MIKPLHGKALKKLYNSFPTKRIAAGALFFNSANKLLIIKPSYLPNWSIPGGVVEAEESPLQSCQRECLEEISLKAKKLQLLCLDYKDTIGVKSESLHVIFYGGRLAKNDVAKIKVDNHEIIAYKFINVKEAFKALGGQKSDLAKRVKYALMAIKSKKVYYLENGIKK